MLCCYKVSSLIGPAIESLKLDLFLEILVQTNPISITSLFKETREKNDHLSIFLTTMPNELHTGFEPLENTFVKLVHHIFKSIWNLYKSFNISVFSTVSYSILQYLQKAI
ncbi:hypothetical protein RclHR1_14860006 [Rhizophagus clarus]|uniref:Uncharacterized protein n=1 Tax=Rhizophagus clarus TaxID=94130 RepID=A0A2Z6QSZ8_9GLOM|nr:hypothetical protein RclHR1_14860006 [Rhizophagus clarus]